MNTLMGEWAYEKFDTIPKPGDSFLDIIRCLSR